MSQRIYIGLRFFADPTFLVILFLKSLGLITLVFLLFSPKTEIDVRFVFGIMISICVALALYRGIVIYRTRRWITPHSKGFVLEGTGGKHQYRDEDIFGLGISGPLIEFSNGNPNRYCRKGILELDSGGSSETIPVYYTFSLKGKDPLKSFFARNIERLTLRAKDRIEQGKGFAGEDWRLTTKGLYFGSVRDEQFLPLDKISDMEVVDNSVRIWKKGIAEPIFSIELHRLNAIVLYFLLAEWFPPAQKEIPEEKGLGRVLVERRPVDVDNSILSSIFGSLILAMLCLVGVCLSLTGYLPWYLGILAFFFMACLGVFAYSQFSGDTKTEFLFRIHSKGLSTVRNGRVTSLYFNEIASFTYNGVKTYVNNVYDGIRTELTFQPKKRVMAQPIKIVFHDLHDHEMEKLRETVSEAIAKDWLHLLGQGKSVEWFSTLRLAPKGIARGFRTWATTQDRISIFYQDITETKLEDGVFYLAVKGKNKWAIKENVNQPNFFPGLVVLTQMLAEHPLGSNSNDKIDEDDF